MLVLHFMTAEHNFEVNRKVNRKKYYEYRTLYQQ